PPSPPPLPQPPLPPVAANVSVEKTTRNALQLRHFWDADVPRAQGAATPLLRPLRDAAYVHGESGREGYDVVDHQRQPLAKPACIAIR
ncbi:nucleoside hydrolase, partial [Salmonella enterica subsp. enterica serovar Infantis]